MAFVHWSLLAGSAAVALPIILHLTGRRQTASVVLPTMRFLQQTQLLVAKGWTIRRLLILAIRCLLLLALVAALASPRVSSGDYFQWILIAVLGGLGLVAAATAAVAYAERKPAAVRLTSLLIATMLLTACGGWSVWAASRESPTLSVSADAPVAGVLIVDTSPAMGYRFENETSLDRAKETGRWILERFPAGSQTTLIGDGGTQRLIGGTADAMARLKRTQAGGRRIDLVAATQLALEVVTAADLDRQEIYVLTDLSAAGWSSAAAALQQLVETHTDTLIQIVDVGADTTVNVALTDVQIAADDAVIGSSVPVSVSVTAASDTPPQNVAVELLVQQPDDSPPKIVDGKLQPPPEKSLDLKQVQITGDQTAVIDFAVQNLPLGTSHYRFRLTSSDALPIDDSYPFSIAALPPIRTSLIYEASVAGPSQPSNNVQLLAAMLDPTGQSVEVAAARSDLEIDREVGLIAIYDPSQKFPRELISRVEQFARQGGSVLTILGPSLDLKAGQSLPADSIAKLIPGKIARLSRTNGEVSLLPTAEDHPMWRVFGDSLSTIVWSQYAVDRHWDLTELPDTTDVLAAYTGSGLPAIAVAPIEQGWTATLTTPIPDVARAGSRPWNAFSTTTDSWLGFGMIYGLAQQLKYPLRYNRNFAAGEVAFVEYDLPQPADFRLLRPDGQSEDVRIEKSLFYPDTQRIGHYYLRATSRAAGLSDGEGFAVHLAPGATDLRRIAVEDLRAVIGDDSLTVTDNVRDLQESIGRGRYGRSMTPFLLLIAVGLLIAESAMARYYYRSQAGGPRKTIAAVAAKGALPQGG